MNAPARGARHLASCLFAALLAGVLAPAAQAAWSNDPAANLMLAPNVSGNTPQCVEDGSGGFYASWVDNFIATVYVQRFGPTGLPLWGPNGVAAATPGNTTYQWSITRSDSGPIVAWADKRNGTFDVFAQKFNGAGKPLWGVAGVPVTAAAGTQQYPVLATDGAGGAFVAWNDGRAGLPAQDVYAQHLSPTGAPVSGWPANGDSVCAFAGDQSFPKIAPDGFGDAFVTWPDNRVSPQRVYAQMISNAQHNGTWGAGGKMLSGTTGGQYAPQVVADGTGGALFAWGDYRNGIVNADVYSLHVLRSGLLPAGWSPNGDSLSSAASYQVPESAVPDGSGGMIVTWEDLRGSDWDIYAQRITGGGAILWTYNGVASISAPMNQQGSLAVSDGSGGVILASGDTRALLLNSGYSYLVAQHVTSGGAIQWGAAGLLLTTRPAGSGAHFNIATNGAGGAFAVWADYPTSGAVYGQAVDAWGNLGPEPLIASVRDVPNDQGGHVKLSFYASPLETQNPSPISYYEVYRSVPPNYAARAIASGSKRIHASGISPYTYFWEAVAYVSPAHTAGYSALAPTAGDSVGGSNPRTLFKVQAVGTTGTQYWDSDPDSGYSVDNLPPAKPAPLVGTYAGASTALHWNRNTEADLAGYRVYRGATSAFVPGPANLVGSPADTGFVDVHAGSSYYKLSAVDSHGNESPFALLSPSAVGAVPGGEARFFLAPATPNPARGASRIRYGLARDASAELAVYDATGRRVRSLVTASLAAGDHEASWDLADDAGREVPAGLYFYRLTVDGRTLTGRVVAMR